MNKYGAKAKGIYKKRLMIIVGACIARPLDRNKSFDFNGF